MGTISFWVGTQRKEVADRIVMLVARLIAFDER